jgi:hypothetical protein
MRGSMRRGACLSAECGDEAATATLREMITFWAKRRRLIVPLCG